MGQQLIDIRINRTSLYYEPKMRKLLPVAISAILCTLTVTAQNETIMDNTLTSRQQHLVVIASLEAKGDLENLTTALNNALDDGLTVSEAKEALSQLYAYTGFPRSLNALNTLQNVISSRDAAGLVTNMGTDPNPLPDDYNALRKGTEVQSTLTGGSYNYAFSPAIDFYLKAHLFGDIFARDNLSFADRELVTISALASIEGIEPQLKSHVNHAPNLGLTVDEIRAIPTVLAERVGQKEAYRANKAIAEVYGGEYTEIPPMDFEVGNPNTAYSQFFVGNSYLSTLATGDGKLPVNNVTFEPGCRNNWHIHHNFNQILICVSGKGWYQEWGKPAQELNPGDVVDIPAGVKHWHGATADSWFQHVVVSTPSDAPNTEWLEAVDNEQYDSIGL